MILTFGNTNRCIFLLQINKFFTAVKIYLVLNGVEVHLKQNFHRFKRNKKSIFDTHSVNKCKYKSSRMNK